MKPEIQLLITVLCAAALNVNSATLIVTSVADSGPGTLRDALASADSGDTIDATGVSGTILLTSGELLVTNSVTILGPGPNYLAVDGNAASRVFNIPFSNEVTIASLTISNGAVDIGGGIYDIGSALTVSNCALRGNLAVGSAGALYALGGAANIVNCTLAGNTLTYGGYGGAIYGSGCTLTIFNSTISGNSNSNGYGGAIYIDGGGTYPYVNVTITGCTISSNYAGVCGGVENNGDNGPVVMIIENSTLSGNSALSVGAIYNSVIFDGLALLSIFNSTLSGNSAQDVGGIAYDGSDFSGEVDMGNTILNAGASGVNVAGSEGINSLGFNLSSDGTAGCCGPGDQSNTDPLLGPLQDNGGPTLTHALLPGSPAIDRGRNINGSATDQRGVGFARTVDDHTVSNAPGGDGTDIGAIEMQRTLPPVAICMSVTVLAGPAGSTDVSIDNGSFDPYGDILAFSQSPPGPYPIGTNEVTLTVIDSQGVSNSCTGLVVVRPRTLIVSNTHDSGPGSLRDALAAGVDGEMIDATGVSGTILLTSGELLVANSVSILGPGPTNLVVNANNASRVFHVTNSASFSVSGITITRGSPPAGVGGVGAGIYDENVSGTLAVSNCIVSASYGGIYFIGSSSTEGALTITGSTIVNDGTGIYFYNNYAAGTLTISNSTIEYNDLGGGIFFYGGRFAVADSTISFNQGDYGGGLVVYAGSIFSTNNTIANSVISYNGSSSIAGGIYAAGQLVITNCTLSYNYAAYGGGGGVYCSGGPLTVINSTLSYNSTLIWGGGIYNNHGVVTIANSTLSGNSAGVGGAIANDGSEGTAMLTIVNCTLSDNKSTGGSSVGGIFNNIYSGGHATLEIGGTILKAGVSGTNLYTTGTVISLGYNLSSDDGGGFLNQPTDLINTDPMLGGLLDNGGPTFTHALLCGSPAVDRGFNFSGSTNDQRGVGFTRTFDDPLVPNAPGGDGTDIGAFEQQAACNKPPVANCKNVSVPVGPRGFTSASIDGGSFDPDPGDTITLTQVPAGPYPVGDTTVTLTVTDNHGASDFCTATVHVQGAAEQIHNLIALVQNLGLPPGTANSLIVKLQAAANALDRDNTQAACGTLGAFLNEVTAQKGKKLTAQQADLLMSDAKNVQSFLSPNSSNP